MGLLPVGWVLVGGFSIGVIGALKAQAEELAHANERQRLLFQEVQHQIANTLQSVVGVLDSANRKIDQTHAEAKNILEEGMRRIMASADIHRRLNDPKLFEQGLGSILSHAVATVIDTDAISVTFETETFDLTFDQMSLITMLVIEFANNAQKHVFEPGLGHEFSVSLKATSEKRAVLTVKDDGPGRPPTTSDVAGRTLGQTIIQNLADQLAGHLTIKTDKGTEVRLVFPIQIRNKIPHARKEGRTAFQAINHGSSITGTQEISG